MIQDLKEIEYRRGMLEKGMKPESLPVKVWCGGGAKISADVRGVVNAENLLNLGGVYDDQNDERLRRIQQVLCWLNKEQNEIGSNCGDSE